MQPLVQGKSKWVLKRRMTNNMDGDGGEKRLRKLLSTLREA